jgi:hypothetical protein
MLPIAEVTAKCTKADLSVICIDAYSALARGQEALQTGSTDSFPWLTGAAAHFEKLGELDNAVMACVKGIDFAVKVGLIEKAYETFSYARTLFENGLKNGDASLSNPIVKQILLKSGQAMIESFQKTSEGSELSDMQAELKASLMGGVALKKAEREDTKDLVMIDGKDLYSKKAKEYKEGAETYIQGGMLKNAVIFACMGALSDLMLGSPKEGMAYLADIAAKSGSREVFQQNPCFIWTKLVFKALVENDVDAIDDAQKKFLEIPWGFKDDREFARRVMDSVDNRLKR